jgi:AbrB family looped-hinge helix DNA binding protein
MPERAQRGAQGICKSSPQDLHIIKQDMTVTLSSKGQIVLPKQVRTRLQLRPGAKLVCRVNDDSIILALEPQSHKRPKLILDRSTGLRITKSPPEVKVSSKDVGKALAGFP